MKIYLTIFASLFLPVFVFAANNVTLVSGAVIALDGVNFEVSGSASSLDTIVVRSGDFDITLDEGQSLKILSPDRRIVKITEIGSLQQGQSCSSSGNLITITNPTGGVTVTTTVGLDGTRTCAAGGGGGGGGGGTAIASGGGGGGAPTIPPQEPVVEEELEPVEVIVAPEIPAQALEPAMVMVSPVFTFNFSKGISHADVKRLQQLLNSDPDTQVAASGVGSPGNETEFFGSLTEVAVKKFQAKYGIVSSGTPGTSGYGLVGPKTSAKLEEVFEGVVAPVVPGSIIDPNVLPGFIRLKSVPTIGEAGADGIVAPQITAPTPVPASTPEPEPEPEQTLIDPNVLPSFINLTPAPMPTGSY